MKPLICSQIIFGDKIPEWACVSIPFSVIYQLTFDLMLVGVAI